MQVTSSTKPISFDYSIYNTVLENVTHTKYLGVTIQSTLKWDIHCRQVAAKETKTLNVLKRKLRSTMDQPKRFAGRQINHLHAHRSSMLHLYSLPGLPKTGLELKGFNAGLHIMCVTHTAGTAVPLRCFNPSTEKPSKLAPNCCYLALSGSVNCTFCLLFSFSGITSHHQY